MDRILRTYCPEQRGGRIAAQVLATRTRLPTAGLAAATIPVWLDLQPRLAGTWGAAVAWRVVVEGADYGEIGGSSRAAFGCNRGRSTTPSCVLETDNSITAADPLTWGGSTSLCKVSLASGRIEVRRGGCRRLRSGCRRGGRRVGESEFYHVSFLSPGHIHHKQVARSCSRVHPGDKRCVLVREMSGWVCQTGNSVT